MSMYWDNTPRLGGARKALDEFLEFHGLSPMDRQKAQQT